VREGEGGRKNERERERERARRGGRTRSTKVRGTIIQRERQTTLL